MQANDPNREQLVKVAHAVRAYLIESIKGLLASSDFTNALPGHVEPSRDVVVAARLKRIINRAS